MASPIVADVIPPVEYTALVDTSGAHSVLMPSVVVQQLRALGFSKITLTLTLHPGDVPRPTMTVMEVADRLRERFHWLTSQAAKARVLRAITAGELPSSGAKRHRRIEDEDCVKWLARELTREASRQ